MFARQIVTTDLQPGDRCVHYRDSSLVGTVFSVDENKLSLMVLWDGDPDPDFQWADKIEKIS